MYQLLRKRLAGKKGFTLIELIVVIAIIAILAVILIPRFTGFTQSAREKSVLSDARNVQMALEALEAQGQFPNPVVISVGEGGDETTTITSIVADYLGKPLEGRITAAANTGGLVSFTYKRTIGGQEYTVECQSGVLTDVTY